MNIDSDSLQTIGTPIFLKEAGTICETIKNLSYEEAKAMWKCNDKLAALNFERFADMNVDGFLTGEFGCPLTPAVLSYEGLAYQHLAASVLTRSALEYLQNHLRILSGFYGMLRPFDGVIPYRLEMQAKLSVEESKDLYDFWGRRLYDAVADGDNLIINLASKEYSQIIEKYCEPSVGFITIEFCQMVDGKPKQKGTFAKMARGEMVRFMAEHQVEDLESIKKFDVGGYRFSEELSTEKKYIFILVG